MTQEQTHQPEASEATPDDGSLDAAALAFETRDESATTQQEASTEEVTEEADPNAEADGETDEDNGETETESIEFEGKTLAVPKELAPELQKALLRQADYSRKMNEVADQGRKLAQRLEHAEKYAAAAERIAEAKAQALIAQHTASQFEKLDWAALERDDPARASLLAVKAMNARQQMQLAQQAIQQAQDEAETHKTSDFAAKREEMVQSLSKSLKGWGDEMGKTLTAYARQSGMAEETLVRLTDPAVVIALDKARKYDEIIKAKDQTKAKAQLASPVVKPGTKRAANPQSDAMASLRKTNSLDDAAAVFLSRMR